MVILFGHGRPSDSLLALVLLVNLCVLTIGVHVLHRPMWIIMFDFWQCCEFQPGAVLCCMVQGGS